MVWSYCRELILDPAKAEAYLAAYDTAQAPTTSTLEAEASAYRTRLAQLQHERERVQDLHRTRPDLMDLTELERQLGILATHKREVQAALTTSEQALAAVVQPTHPFRDAAAVLTSLQHETIALGETPTPAEQRDVLNHLTPRVTIHLTDDTPRAGASTVTIRLFGRSPFRADSVTSNSIDMSSEESYTHVQALPTLTHEQRSANARKAQVTKRAHGIALGPTPRLNAAQTQALLADRAQGMTTVTLAAKYGESRRFVWHVLQRHGDPLPPVSLTYSHLSPEQIQALVGDRAAGMTHQRLAAAYGVSKDYVATVLKREGDPTRQPSTQCSLPFKEAV